MNHMTVSVIEPGIEAAAEVTRVAGGVSNVLAEVGAGTSGEQDIET